MGIRRVAPSLPRAPPAVRMPGALPGTREAMPTEIKTRDLKLIQYLNEAYGKERELETSLQAHIAMTTRAPYKRRLREHLTETKGHAQALKRRIKQLGG